MTSISKELLQYSNVALAAQYDRVITNCLEGCLVVSAVQSRSEAQINPPSDIIDKVTNWDRKNDEHDALH